MEYRPREHDTNGTPQHIPQSTCTPQFCGGATEAGREVAGETPISSRLKASGRVVGRRLRYNKQVRRKNSAFSRQADAPGRVDGLDGQHEAFLVAAISLGRQFDDRVSVEVQVSNAQTADELLGAYSGILRYGSSS